VEFAVQELLGDHGLRSPGRFAFLWSFGIAVLAGLGVDWLDNRTTGLTSQGRMIRWGARLWMGTVLTLLGAAAAGLLLAAYVARGWLVQHPEAARRWLAERFLAFDPTTTVRATVDDVYRSLLVTLDPANPHTVVWAMSVVVGYGLLLVWLVSGARRHTAAAQWEDQGGRAGPRQAARAWLRALTLAVVALPLLTAGARAHPVGGLAAIEPNSGAAHYLRAQLAPPDAPVRDRPLYRVYTSQPVYLYHYDDVPNALVPLGVQEAGGYSSVRSERSTAYAWSV
jgi:hypothetical protein